MAPLGKVRIGCGSNRSLTCRTTLNEFADFDTLSCPNSFNDDPTVDEFFEQRQAEGLVAGIAKASEPFPLAQLPRLRPQRQPAEESKIPPRNQTIELKSIIRPVIRLNSFIPADSSVGQSKTLPTHSSNANDSTIVSANTTRSGTAGKHRTMAAAFAESARKGIQRRSQSIRQKIMPRRPCPAKSGPAEDEKADDDASRDPPPATPFAPLTRPRSPPKTRNKRLGPPGPGNTLVNPQCLPSATHGYRVVAQPTVPQQDILKRHVFGRWSYPMSAGLVEEIDPEDQSAKVAATPLHTRPPHSRKKIVVEDNDNTNPVDTPRSAMVRASSLVMITPKRKKSLIKGTRIQFNHRDSLRKLSLTKTMIIGKQPVIVPSKMKPSLRKTRNPYAHIKSKVGEVFRSVLPKRDAGSVKRSAKETLNTSKLNSTTSSSCANSSTISAPGLSTSVSGDSSKHLLPRVRQPSSKSPTSVFGGSGSFRYPNPPGKTLAQLVKDFHRTPPRFRSRPSDNRCGKKTII